MENTDAKASAKKPGRQQAAPWKRIKSGKSSFKNPKPTVQKCAKCGLRIRGANHENGGHHKGSIGFRKEAGGF